MLRKKLVFILALLATAENVALAQDAHPCYRINVKEVHVFDHNSSKVWDVKIPFNSNSHKPDLVLKFTSRYVAKDDRQVISKARSRKFINSNHIKDVKLYYFDRRNRMGGEFIDCSIGPLEKRSSVISIIDADLRKDDHIDSFNITLSHEYAKQDKIIEYRGDNSSISVEHSLATPDRSNEMIISEMLEVLNENEDIKTIKGPLLILKIDSIKLEDGRVWIPFNPELGNTSMDVDIPGAIRLGNDTFVLNSLCKNKWNVVMNIFDANKNRLGRFSNESLECGNIGTKTQSLMELDGVLSVNVLTGEFSRREYVVSVLKTLLKYEGGKRSYELKSKYRIRAINIDEKMKPVRVKSSPIYYIPKGQQKVIEDVKRFRRSESLSISRGKDDSASIHLPLASIEVRQSIEKASSTDFSIENEYKRSVTLIGNDQGLKVVWLDLFRTGHVELEINNGRTIEIQKIYFEYKDGFDLIVVKVEEEPQAE